MAMATQADTGKINAVHSMLHLIFHRNKNQHGSSKWWKWLSTLKRTTLKLRSALENDLPYNKPDASVDAYKMHLAIHTIPRCYLAFSTVVADSQFSTLGVVLLTLLADLASAIQVKVDFTAMPRPEKVASKRAIDIGAAAEDVGEVICRGKNLPALTESTAAGSITTEPVSNSTVPKSGAEDKAKAYKKKSRKKNTIDELFNNFL